MRTGIPDVEKGITRFSAGLRKQLVDNLLAGKKIRPAMIKDMTLNEVQDLSALACHKPILWEQSATHQYYGNSLLPIKLNLLFIVINGKRTKNPQCSGTFIFHLNLYFNIPTMHFYVVIFCTVIRIRKRCQFCLTKGKKEVKTQFCCAQCGDVALCMQQDVKTSCWTLWHKKVYLNLNTDKKGK